MFNFCLVHMRTLQWVVRYFPYTAILFLTLGEFLVTSFVMYIYYMLLIKPLFQYIQRKWNIFMKRTECDSVMLCIIEKISISICFLRISRDNCSFAVIYKINKDRPLHRRELRQRTYWELKIQQNLRQNMNNIMCYRYFGLKQNLRYVNSALLFNLSTLLKNIIYYQTNFNANRLVYPSKKFQGSLKIHSNNFIEFHKSRKLNKNTSNV